MSNDNNMMGCGLVQDIPLSTTSHISILAVSLVPTVHKQMSEPERKWREIEEKQQRERERDREERQGKRDAH